MTRVASILRSTLILALASAVVVASGATWSARAAGGPVELRIVFSAQEHVDALKPALDAFRQENPEVRIDVQTIPWQQFFERVETMIAGGRVPDLLYTPMLATGRYAELGLLLDITDRVPADMREDFLPGPWSSVVFGGRAYGLPYFADDIAAFYNKDAFAKAGVQPPTPEDRWTWDELLEAARRVKQANGMPYGITTGSDVSQWLPYLYQAGGTVLNQDHTAAGIDSPDAIRAIRYFQSWFTEGLAPAGVFTGAEQGEVLFEQGKVPIIVTFSGYIIGRFDQNIRTFQFGVLPMPKDRYVANKLGGYNLVAFKATRHPDVVYKLMEFLARPEWMAHFAMSQGVFPARRSAWDLVDYGRYAQDMELIWKEIEEVPEFAVRDFSTPKYLGYKNILTRHLQLVVLGQKSPEQAARDIAAEINRTLFR